MDGMKPGTIELDGARLDLSYPAIVPPELRNDVLEISNLLTESAVRRQNRASSLLQEVCLQADQDSKWLIVLVGAFGKDGPSTERLTDWYISKFGFTPLQLHPQPLLMRMPQPWISNG